MLIIEKNDNLQITARKMLDKETSPRQGKSRGRLGRGSTTVLYTYIPYNDLKLKHHKKTKNTIFQKYLGWRDEWTDGPTDLPTDQPTRQGVESRVRG